MYQMSEAEETIERQLAPARALHKRHGRLLPEEFSAPSPIVAAINAHAQEMTPDRDRETPEAWWGYISAHAATDAPLGVYVLTSQLSDDYGDVQGAGLIVADQHGHGKHFGVEGPWLAAGHIFHHRRGRGYHSNLVHIRLAALKFAGITHANTGVAPDNSRSLVTMIKCGFVPFAIGPSLDPNGTGATTVFMHWEAKRAQAPAPGQMESSSKARLLRFADCYSGPRSTPTPTVTDLDRD